MSEEVRIIEEILYRAASVPELIGYPTVDALLAELEALRERHPGQLTAQRIGTSRLGEPIHLYTLTPAGEGGAESGEERLSGLLAGGVHPNEPIGSWTIVHLVRELTEDPDLARRLGTVWHLVPCADPDAMRLNEGWFARPEDRETYFRNFYRPAGREQVEWTFPFSYKRAYFDAMMPETQALQRAIDLTRPDFYVPLHNAESGGAYYYLSEPAPELYGILHRLPEQLGIPLHRGEPEAGHFEELDAGIFAMGTLEAVYDWMEELGLDPVHPGAAGEASTGYARRYGSLSLIAEMPIWTHAQADDTAETQESYSALLEQESTALQEAGEVLTGLLGKAEEHLSMETPFIRAGRSFLPTLVRAAEGHRARAAQPESRRPATVSEKHSLRGLLHMLRLRFGAIFLRAVQAEIAAGTAPAALRRVGEETEEVFSRWLTEADADESGDFQPLPVKDVVGLQYGAVLALADHCLRRRARAGSSAACRSQGPR